MGWEWLVRGLRIGFGFSKDSGAARGYAQQEYENWLCPGHEASEEDMMSWVACTEVEAVAELCLG